MSSHQQLRDTPLEISLEQIGGIDALDMEIPPGVTVLAGDNATNRSSTLYGLMAAFGSDHPGITVKTGFETGTATLTIGDETYSQTVTQTKTGHTLSGDQYLENPTVANQYAFLLRDNPVRQAVETDGDLYSILMDPVDTKKIDHEINQLRKRRQRLADEIEIAKEAADALPRLEERRQKKQDELEELEAERDEIKAEQQQLREKATPEYQEKLETISTKRTTKEEDLQGITRQIERAQTKIGDAKDTLDDLNIPDVDLGELEAERSELESRINTLRQTKREITQVRSKIKDAKSTAQSLLQADRSLTATLASLPRDVSIPEGPLSLDQESKSAPELTSELSTGTKMHCPACGADTNTDDVEAVIEQYTELQQALSAEIDAIDNEITSAREEVDDISEKISQRDDKIEKKTSAEQAVQDAKNKIERLEKQKADLEDDIDELRSKETELEQEIADTEDVDAIQSELMEVQNDIGSVEKALENITEQIEEKEIKAEKEETLRDELETVTSEYETKANQIDTIEQEIVEKFNGNMDEILSILSYNNIARAWIERKPGEENDKTEFDLHIIRETETGVQEGQLQHLSESERAVVALTVALTGYLVHDVAADCPVILLDSIEMIDTARIKNLLEYFGAHTDYLIATLLSEDAAQMPTDQFTVIGH